MTDHLAEFLPWDSQHFGWRIASAKVDRLNESTWRELDDWCRRHEIDCLYFMAEAADQATIRQALRLGFDLVETRIVFEHNYKKAPPIMPATDGFSLRLAKPADVVQLMPIVKGSFSLSRFHADRCLDKDKVEQMYQIWVRKSVTSDYDDFVHVAEVASEPVGYITGRLNYLPGVGKTGLTSVVESAQGKGIGLALMRYASFWFQQQGMRRSHAVTQASNIGGQILHQRAGYVTRAAQQFFHKWFRPCR